MIDTKNWFQLRPMYSYIRKQAENEKFLNYLEVGSTFTLIAFFLFFAIMPTLTTISSLVGEIKSKEAFNQKADVKIASILKAQDAYAQIQEKYYLIEDSFPTSAQYYDGASNLATIFKESSLSVDQLNFQLSSNDPSVSKNKNKQSFQTYQIGVNGEGTYAAAMDMVQKILQNRRLIDPINIRLDQATSDNKNPSSSNDIKVSVSSDLYYLPNNTK